MGVRMECRGEGKRNASERSERKGGGRRMEIREIGRGS